MGRRFQIFVAMVQLLLEDVLCLQDSNRRRHVRCPSMFVAVVSSSENHERRSEIRSMWQDHSRYGNQLIYKYAVCTNGTVTRDLQKEQDKHGDIMLMDDCEEGYLNGLLTRKVASAMRNYVNTYPWIELFMKIDDDAYLSTNRLCNFMDTQQQAGKDLKTSYVGVFAEQDEKLQRHLVIRDPDSEWFEPKDKYPYKTYPLSAKGGPGYILPFKAVNEIISRGYDHKFELNNEDKAVGYWVSQLKSIKIKNFVNMRGTDGYDEHKQSASGTFHEYPHIVHHHLEGTVISCLHEVEATMDPEATIDHCFKMQLFGIRKEHVRIHMPY